MSEVSPAGKRVTNMEKQTYLAEARRLGACFSAASLFEVCVTPSPGLVSPRDTGAHDDMNHLTFMIGSSVLASYFTEFARLGLEEPDQTPKELFEKLRSVGRDAERELLEASHGVNTQRGQLFLLGIAAGVAGLCLARGQKVPSLEFYGTVREACAGLCARELPEADLGYLGRQADLQNLQSVENLRRLERAATGARGEAEAGFPVVEKVGYPAFEHGLRCSLGLNDSAVHALISMMSVVVDTTVLRRLGASGIELMHETSRRILDCGSVFTHRGREMILEAHDTFSRMRLSPGGAADLLALTIALYFVDQGFPSSELLLTPSLFGGTPPNVAVRI